MIYSQRDPNEIIQYMTIGNFAIGKPNAKQQWINEFLASRRQGLSQRTLEFYRDILYQAVDIELTPEGINSWLSSLKLGNAKRNYYTAMKVFCNWLYKSKKITKNPIESVDPPNKRKRIQPYITKTQLNTLAKNVSTPRDACIIKLFFDSGCRLSEVANMKDTDFNWDKSQVTVIGKGDKQRNAPFTKATGKMLKNWFNTHQTFEISSSGIQTILVRLEKQTGIKCNPHAFRRGFAIHQLKRGLSTRVVQQLGGWESITMVERYSQNLSQEDALELYNQD